jgi:hypothetical protein
MTLKELKKCETEGKAILLKSVPIFLDWNMELWEIQDKNGNIDKYIKTCSNTIILQSDFRDKLFA